MPSFPSFLGANKTGAAYGEVLRRTMPASSSTLTIWQNITFTIELTNNGTESATGIAVDVPIPAGNLAYTNSTASDGSYDLFFKEWNINSLAAGQTATLDIELFVLQNSTPLPYFVEVVAASPADLDSSPGNNTTGTPEEDDEALITLQPPGNQLAIATGEFGNAVMSGLRNHFHQNEISR